jgi:hypothetical protein
VPRRVATFISDTVAIGAIADMARTPEICRF